MNYDMEIPTSREAVFVPIPFAGPQEIVKIVQDAEKLGYHTVWGTDFMTLAPGVSPLEDPDPPNWYELIVSLSYLAAVTDRIMLGAGVILLPYRDPVILARQITTLDHFSNGRVALGLGLGNRAEYEMVQPRMRKVHRGRMLDEKMEALHQLFDHSQRTVSYSGKYVEFRDVEVYPKPVQNPLPIYAPGRNPDALARIARWGNGLFTAASAGRSAIDALEPLLEQQGRSLDDIHVVAEGELSLGATHEEAVEHYRSSMQGQFRLAKGFSLESIVEQNWIGTVDEVVDKIGKLKDLGINHVNALHIAGDTIPEMMEQVESFAKDVMAKVG